MLASRNKYGTNTRRTIYKFIEYRGMKLKPVDFAKVGKQGCFVYCYLREKDRTPYYIGIAKRSDRITAHHTVNIPPDKRNIRILRSGLTHMEAQKWEMFYIAHYGRKDNGTGILRNQTDGGETGGLGRIWSEEQRRARSELVKGRKHNDETRAKISANRCGKPFHPGQREALEPVWRELATEQAEKMGIEVDEYLALPQEMKRVVIDRFKYGGWKSEDLMKELDGENRYKRAGLRQKLGAAEKYGIDPDAYIALNDRQRQKVAERYSSGMRGERLLLHLDLDMRTAISLDRYEVSLEFWSSLDSKQKGQIRSRYNRGGRGSALFVGINPTRK